MSYIGSTYSQQLTTPAVDYFNGNGITTTFQLSRSVTSVNDFLVVVNNVPQNPREAYGITASNQIAFTSAPSVGTNNIYVIYNSQVGQSVTPSPGTVTSSSLAAGAVTDIALAPNSVTTNAIAPGAVVAVDLDVVSLTGAGAMVLPKGTTAQRPVGATAGTGAIRYNTSNNTPEVWNGNLWASIIIASADGSSVQASATSAQAIKSITGTTTSGYYWITVGGTPTQVWCDMTGATAWMLLMRLSSGGNTFGYDSAFWQNGTTGLNATGDPLTNIDIKNGQMWGFANVTTMRLTGSTNATLYTANPLTFGAFSATPNTIFNAGSNTWDAQVGYTRAEWLAWGVAACGNTVANFDSQPNCNTTCVNNTGTGPYARVRIGWCGNNENDCATNDSWVGPGGFWNGTQFNGGAQSWSPNVYTPAHMWLWTNTV
jgi:hypothetical protein